VSFSALLAALAYLPTSNLLFASGIVLAERNLYLPVLLPAAIFGTGVAWALQRWERSRVPLAAAVLLAALAARSLVRLPAWADNRSFLLTLLSEHPESYRGQQSAAAVLAGMGKPMEARAVYARADSLFGGDPHLKAGYAFLLIGQGDTAGAVPLARAARQIMPRERVALRVDYLLARARGERAHAAALADTALRWFPLEREWYAEAVRP
jgi:predicted Zn-dependent protease